MMLDSQKSIVVVPGGYVGLEGTSKRSMISGELARWLHSTSEELELASDVLRLGGSW
jgi:hypothetical protein